MKGHAESISDERVRAVVTDLLGVQVRGVTRLAGSVSNQDFLVDGADGIRLVLKAGPGTEIAAEAWACAHLAGIGMPVPQVIAHDLDASTLGSPFLVESSVMGEPSRDAVVVREAGSWMRRAHQEWLPGWGPLQVCGEPAGRPRAEGRYASWGETVETSMAGLPALTAAGVIDEELADAARRLVLVESVLGYDGAGVLLHHDLKPAHLFGLADGNHSRLTAIIDWGDACVGDPMAEIARLSMSGPAMTAAFLDGYGVEHTDELDDRLARYRILWNVRTLDHEFRAGGDWFDAYRRQIHDDAVRLLTGAPEATSNQPWSQAAPPLP